MRTPFENPLFDTEGAIYMGSRRDPNNCTVGLFGVPYDGTTSFRPGTRFGPAAIREVSNGLETYCPQLGLDLEDLAFVDLGAVVVNTEVHAPGFFRESNRDAGVAIAEPRFVGIVSGVVEKIFQYESQMIAVAQQGFDILQVQTHAVRPRRCEVFLDYRSGIVGGR